ncbi:MAG: hypothetical protein IJJ41_09455 [Clostridia bacterium]|nr:hypothetical protein [Clostridia bacterium]
MFMSALWDTVFSLNDRYENAEVFLIDNHIPALRFGHADKPVVFAGGFGAAEWQSGVLLLQFFEHLLFDADHGKSMAGIAVRKAFKKRSVVIIPTVCPPKMAVEEPLHIEDLSPLAKYLSFHPAGMLVCLNGADGAIYAPASNELLPFESETVEKILCACSNLPAGEKSRLVGARFCAWASQKALLPSFVISPASLEASAIAHTYRALEETFAVAALL